MHRAMKPFYKRRSLLSNAQMSLTLMDCSLLKTGRKSVPPQRAEIRISVWIWLAKTRAGSRKRLWWCKCLQCSRERESAQESYCALGVACARVRPNSDLRRACDSWVPQKQGVPRGDRDSFSFPTPQHFDLFQRRLIYCVRFGGWIRPASNNACAPIYRRGGSESRVTACKISACMDIWPNRADEHNNNKYIDTPRLQRLLLLLVQRQCIKDAACNQIKHTPFSMCHQRFSSVSPQIWK